MQVKKLTDLDVSGKRVFIRADLNVPQDDTGAITEDTRVRASVPCIQMALDAGAAVMVTSHLGRPTEGAFKPEDSLAPVAARLGELLGREVPLVANWVDGVDVKPGQVKTVEGSSITVKSDGGKVMVDNATVTAVDVRAGSGHGAISLTAGGIMSLGGGDIDARGPSAKDLEALRNAAAQIAAQLKAAS